MQAFAEQKRRRGYRKAWNKLRRNGMQVSKNRVHRLWKQGKLQVKKRVGKKRKPLAKSGSLPLVALYPGHVWSVDFIFDATAGGPNSRYSLWAMTSRANVWPSK